MASMFRIASYTTLASPAQHFWRGYFFEVSRPLRIVGLLGGATSTNFAVGIYRANSSNLVVGRLGSVKMTVSGRGGVWTISPVEIFPGTRYFLGQGRLNSNSGSHYGVNQFPDMVSATEGLITYWYPSSSTSCRWNIGSEDYIVNRNFADLNSYRPDVGFYYEEAGVGISYVKKDGIWRKAEKSFVKVDGVWREVLGSYVKRDGIWSETSWADKYSQNAPSTVTLNSMTEGENGSVSWSSVSTASNGYDVEVYKNGIRVIFTHITSTSYTINSSHFTSGDQIYVGVRARSTSIHYNSSWTNSVTRTVNSAVCETGCEVSCETGCEVSCENCEGACETGCEVSCQEWCEVYCEEGCEVSCEEGCEVSCQEGCEVCETGCMVNCEEWCESLCEVYCEVYCEEGCEECQQGCEVSCQEGCEVSCDTQYEMA